MSDVSTPQPESSMPKRIHTTLTEHRIEYDPSPEVEAFLTRLEDMISDPKVNEQQMIGVAYSRENPLLDKTMHPIRAMVTKDVFDDPAYAVMADLLFRKRVAQEKVDVNKLAAKYTVTVAQAAEQLGIHQSAVRQAIEARRLASWMKDGKHFLEPSSLASFAQSSGKGRAGKKSEMSSELDIVLGHAAGASLRVRSAKPVETIERVDGNVVHGRLAAGWKKIVVLTTAGNSKRGFALEPGAPGAEPQEINHPPFYVRGNFHIYLHGNSAKKTGDIWDKTAVE